MGSFLNVLIIRLPQNQDIFFKSSSCMSCHHQLRWYHLIPLLSAIFLRFKCAYCHQSFSKQYFIVEIITAVFTLLFYQKLGFSFDFFALSALFYTLIILAFIDLKYKAVPDYLLLIAFILVFVVQHNVFLESLQNALLFAGAFVLLEFLVTFYIQNIKIKWSKDKNLQNMKALGEGDIPIVAIIGALLGVSAGVFAIFLAAFFAIMPSLYQSIKKEDAQTPFIPYLLMGLATEYFFEVSKVIF